MSLNPAWNWLAVASIPTSSALSDKKDNRKGSFLAGKGKMRWNIKIVLGREESTPNSSIFKLEYHIYKICDRNKAEFMDGRMYASHIYGRPWVTHLFFTSLLFCCWQIWPAHPPQNEIGLPSWKRKRKCKNVRVCHTGLSVHITAYDIIASSKDPTDWGTIHLCPN